VVGAGTGGTSASIGRYLRYQHYTTRLAVVDPERSVLYAAWAGFTAKSVKDKSVPRMEEIGRTAVGPRFVPSVIDHMVQVPDAASLSAMRLLADHIGHRVGPSSGANLWGALRIAAEKATKGQKGSIVTLICDNGEGYANTWYDSEWVRQEGLDADIHSDELHNLLSASPAG